MPPRSPKVEVHPATPDRWKDVETLFGPRGACAGCWCQYFKLPGPDYSSGKGATNKARLEESVKRGDVPGLLAYVDGKPAAWCAVEPKERYQRLSRSRTFKDSAREETATTWSVPCFFTAREHRGNGLAGRLLEAAFARAVEEGATLVEGYPVKPSSARMPDTFAYYGTVDMFEKAGFDEAAAPSKSRRIMTKRAKTKAKKTRTKR